MIKFLKRAYFPLALIFIGVVCGTGAYYSSNATLSNNEFSVGTWSVTPTVTTTATATATSTPGSDTGDVVINEMMWMGSTIDSDDEWIELRNMTNTPIDLSGWQISKFVSSEQPMLTISSGTIPANGYFLISKFGKDNLNSALNVEGLVSNLVGLRNSNLQIKLYKGSISPSNLIDIADDGSGDPLVGYDNGSAGPRQSMSRNLTPGEGTQATNWYTDTVSNSTTYWDNADGNYGTPGGPNV